VFLIDSLHASLTFVGRASLRNWRGSVLSEREFRPAIEASVSDGQVDKAGREGHAKAESDPDWGADSSNKQPDDPGMYAPLNVGFRG
jgi:hypothetical protein